MRRVLTVAAAVAAAACWVAADVLTEVVRALDLWEDR